MPTYQELPPWNKPFAEQLAFFKRKLNLPSEAWDDILRSAHDKAFIVAGAQGADLLVDLRAALTKAIASGTGIEAFRKEFKQIVAKNGWTGWTGEESEARAAWRTKVIYQTNMTTSYAAGRWQQLNNPELLKAMPYWQYKHSDSVVYPRPLHQSWDGLTLSPDHPFWKEHYPPNGWGCQCRVIPVTKAAFLKAVANGRGPAAAPHAGNKEGIDEGFEYAPGSNVDMQLRQAVQDKLIQYPPAISKALSKDINRRINGEQTAAGFARQSLDRPELQDLGFLGFVENPEQLSELLDNDVTGYMVLTSSDTIRHIEKSHAHDGKSQRPPVPDDFNQLLDMINNPDKLMLSDEASTNDQPRIVAIKEYAGEVFRAVFEMRSGQKNRAFRLVTFFIKR